MFRNKVKPFRNLKYLTGNGILTIAIALIIAIALFLFVYFIDHPKPGFEYINKNIEHLLSFREGIQQILFRFSPFIVTVVIAISSLTVNSFTGSFFANLISDLTLKILVGYTTGFLLFHTLTAWFIPINLKDQTTIDLKENLVSLIFFDASIAFINILLAILVSIHIFFYSWPKTLKDKFALSIKYYLNKLDIGYSEKNTKKKKKIDKYKSIMNRYIIWFTNLLSNSIKSKDFEVIEGIVVELIDVWKFMIQINEEKQSKLDKEFYKLLDLIDENGDYIEKNKVNDEFAEVFEESLETIISVFTNAFKQGYEEKEYFVCEIIIDKLYQFTIGNSGTLSRDDLEKVLDIYSRLFEISIKDESDKDSLLSTKIIKSTNSIYADNIHKINDLSIYFSYLYNSVDNGEYRFLNTALEYFGKIFDEENLNSSMYNDTLNQLYKLMLFSLKKKRMRSFANLVRFCVTSNLNLTKINDILVKNIKTEDSSIFDDVFEEFGLSDKRLNKDPDYYNNVKIYVVWYSYYLLQRQISSDRIAQEYHNLTVANIKNNVPFKFVRTLLLDLETHSDSWNTLFVNQCSHFFLLTCGLLVNKRDINQKVENQLKKLAESSYLKELTSYVIKGKT
ncbi:hypothetical protein ACFS6F_10420 [Halobacillus naozhouensis]